MLQTLARNWWAIVLRGVFAVLFGIGTFVWPGLTLAALVLLLGGYLVVDGVLAVLWALSKRNQGAFSWEVFLVGLASLGAGIVTLLWPGVTALALLWVLAVWAIVRGIFEILAAFHLRKELSNEWLLILNGVLTVLFGLVLIFAPVAGILAALWMLGTFAIIAGIVMIVLGFRLKGVKHAVIGRPAYGR